MHVNAHLDVDLVAVEQQDRITLMLELVAPAPDGAGRRAPATVEVVLDRSGSMAGPPLAAAQRSLRALVDRLDADDRFGLVAFDDEVHVAVPAGPVADKPALKAAIGALGPGGTTNLSGGLVRGMQEAQRVAGEGGATLLLLSDGHANAGVTDPALLEVKAAAAHRAGVVTSTIGLGLGYDERALAAIARGGRGDHVFAEAADDAVPAVAGQVDGLLSRAVQAASLLIRPTGDVQGVTIHNDVPGQGVQGGVMLELGDLWAGETRRLLLGLDVPAMPALGLAIVATLELRYTALPAFTEETVTLPVSVNVVPGDQAAGRVPDPKVRTELEFLRAQDAKRRAADALAEGDEGGALSTLDAACAALAAAPPSAELDEEGRILRDLAGEVRAGASPRAAKRSRMDVDRKSRKRGRGA